MLSPLTSFSSNRVRSTLHSLQYSNKYLISVYEVAKLDMQDQIDISFLTFYFQDLMVLTDFGTLAKLNM